MIETYYKVSHEKFKGKVLKTTNKKEADAHDKMLDRADKVMNKIEDAVKAKDLDSGLTESQIEDVSIHISKNAADYAKILKGVKKIE